MVYNVVPDYGSVPIDTFDFEGLKERLAAEATLQRLGETFQVVLYSDALPGFYVNDPEEDRKQRFAKDSVFHQAVQWFDEWVKN
jgi:hypothetical protein